MEFHQRHATAVDRAERALRDLDREAGAINFQAVAQRAGSHASGSTPNPSFAPRSNGVATTSPPPASPRPASAPAARRCASAPTHCAPTTSAWAENAALKDELAIAYGRQRAAS